METGQPPVEGVAAVQNSEQSFQDNVAPANAGLRINITQAAEPGMQPSSQEAMRLGGLHNIGTAERGARLGVAPLNTNVLPGVGGPPGSLGATMANLAQINAMNARMQMPQYQQQMQQNMGAVPVPTNMMAPGVGVGQFNNPNAAQFNQQNAALLNLLAAQQRFTGGQQAQTNPQAAAGTSGLPSPYVSGSPYAFMSPNYAAQMRQPGQLPPAKRQAVSSGTNPYLPAQLQLMQQMQFQQMFMAARGMPFQMPGMQQYVPRPAGSTPYSSSRQGSQSTSNNRGNMRVQIDKRNRSSYDAHFLAEETNDKAHADEVVKRCEEISKALKSHLGNTAASDRFGATDTDNSYQQVTLEKLKECCGSTAKYLKPYQIVGVNFLMLLYRTRIGGAILADEMGLGKTAQLITYLGAIRNLENDPGPHLVVVPASLLENWQRELRRWCPGLKTVVYYGKHRNIVRKRLTDLRDRLARGEQIEDDLADLADADQLAEAAASERMAEAAAMAAGDHKDEDPLGLGIMHESDDEFDLKRDTAKDAGKDVPPVEEPPPRWDPNTPLQAAPFNVMLTCYTLFERDSPEQRDDRKFLEGWRWSHLVMDEAHALKNRNASRTTRLRRVANASRRRVMMTGTPLQNDLVELQNLLHFLLPQVFAVQGMEDFENMLQGDETEINRLTDRMKSLLGPFVLRRLKTEVAGQLTEKKHSTEFIEMTTEQQGMYEASVQQMRSQITSSKSASAVAEGGDVEKFMKSLGAKKINHIFTHLRKIAQHPLLIRHHYDDATVDAIAAKAVEQQIFSGNATKKKVLDELLAYSDYSLHAFCYNHGPEFFMYRLNSKHLMSSAKFKFLGELLPKLKAEGSRPLIFSQWTAVLDIIEWLMDELRLPYVRLDGSTAVDERLATVDKFNMSEDVFAFLLSTRAGGQGLNLTGADTVIIHDVDFNPQIDRQAEDRCHRLGQTRPVMVYRLITKSSVDQNIFNLSQRKLKLDRAVLDGITSGKGAGRGGMSAEERQQMGFILHSLFAGKEDYDQMAAVLPDEIEDEQPDWKKEEKKNAENPPIDTPAPPPAPAAVPTGDNGEAAEQKPEILGGPSAAADAAGTSTDIAPTAPVANGTASAPEIAATTAAVDVVEDGSTTVEVAQATQQEAALHQPSVAIPAPPTASVQVQQLAVEDVPMQPQAVVDPKLEVQIEEVQPPPVAVVEVEVEMVPASEPQAVMTAIGDQPASAHPSAMSLDTLATTTMPSALPFEQPMEGVQIQGQGADPDADAGQVEGRANDVQE